MAKISKEEIEIIQNAEILCERPWKTWLLYFIVAIVPISAGIISLALLIKDCILYNKCSAESLQVPPTGRNYIIAAVPFFFLFIILEIIVTTVSTTILFFWFVNEIL
jgi:hypothetical protein